MTTQIVGRFDLMSLHRRTYTLSNLDEPITGIPSAEFRPVIKKGHQAQLEQLGQLGEGAKQIGSDLLMIGGSQSGATYMPDVEAVEFEAVDESASIVKIAKKCDADWPQIEERFLASVKKVYGNDVGFQYESSLTGDLVAAGAR